MLYTIGYQDKRINEFIEALKKYEVTHLFDVRSRPTSRNASYRLPFLSSALHKNGILYTWVGDKLGGFTKIHERDIRGLAEFQRGREVCVMCMEADPLSCHRYYEIGKRITAYGVEVRHIVKADGQIRILTV